MKVFFRRIHLYLSLAAGAVILVACLTGAFLVFEKDLQMALNKERYYVTPGGAALPLSTLTQKVKQTYPGAKINSIKVYKDASRSTELNINLAPKEKKEATATAPATGKAANAKPERAPGYTVFMNPYTGDVLALYSYRETFFYTIFALHRWLLGGEGSVGKYIVGISTFIFLFILITGIILWWPRTRNVLQKRIKIKWDAGWKRLNHDLHIVLGFYSAIFLFIFAFTGLAWSFEWFNKGIYTVTKSPMKNPEPPKSVYAADAKTIDYDAALAMAGQAAPDVKFYSLSLPKDSMAALTVTSLPANAIHESATNALYLDQYTGQVIGRLNFEDRSTGAQVRSSFKPIHTGSIWGWPSKIIAFITCLFGVSFPVTGVIMWINRTRKKKKAVKEGNLKTELAEA